MKISVPPRVARELSRIIGFTEIVLQQVAGVPGELVRRMPHKVVRPAAVPNLVQRLFIDIVHAQQRQRLQLMVAYPFTHIRRALHTATQLFFGGEIELA